MDKQVILFVEGDTDEVFFRQLLSHYARVSATPLLPCKICNLHGITRYATKLRGKLRNDYIPAAKQHRVSIEAVCCSYDTDVFDACNPMIVNWGILRRAVLKMGVNTFVQLGIERSIEDWILCDLAGIQRFLKLREAASPSPKGSDGNAKLANLYSMASRVYQKGYQAKSLIYALDMAIIREKNKGVLGDLEHVLGVTI